IVLADQVESRFDDDRARRLHAAADYVAAVVAEARLQRQVEAAQKRSEAQAAEAETRLQEAERRQLTLSEGFANERVEWEQLVARLREDHENQRSALKAESAAAAETLQTQFNERLARAVRRHEELHAQWQEVHQAEQKLRESLDAERREWTHRSEEWQRQEITRREEWEQQRAAREAQIDQLRTELGARDDELSRRSRAHEEQLQGLRMQAEELQRSAAEEQRRLREELQSLRAAIAERERHLTAERDAERGQAREDHDRLTSELQSLHTLLTERERQVTDEREDERRRHAEQVSERERQLAGVQTELAALREQLAERRQEIAALQSEMEARRRELAEAHEKAERRLAEMAKTHAGQLEAEREATRQTTAELSAEKENAAAAISHLEEHLGALRQESDRALAHWSAEMEAQRQLSRQRLDEATEKLRSVESVIAGLLAALSSSDPFDAILARIQDRLPPGSELWLWRRLPDARPALLAVRRDEETRAGDDVSVHAPWRFEAETIPAEGVTIVPDAEAWTAREEYEDQYHRERWDETWGKGQRPSWAVCWPWAGSDMTAGENGWLTSFGFGTERPPDHRKIELLSIYAGAIGALVMRSMHPSAAPTAEPRSETGDCVVPASMVEESVAGLPRDPDTDLHAAVIAWVADQKDDEWRLDLGAPVPPLVNERWLAEVLDAVRASCRNGGDGTPNRFAIETRPSDGGAQLRLANQSLADSADNVVSDETSGDGSPATAAADPGALHCRWLTSGGHRIGVEITFPETAAADLSISPAPLQVLVADDQPPMAELLAGMLQSLGHNAVTCGGAQEAYSRFVTEHFDVVITSGTMPQDTGLALAGWIKSHNPTTPVILLAEPGVVSGSEPGEPCWDRTLEKPFHIDQLQDVLRSFRHGAREPFRVDAVSAG
ncbi:MAG: response regulator, partial [Candidatus Zixiibacteriota bacterium]